MKMWVLGSGSRGNAVLLESGTSRVLIDAGFGVRTLQQRLVHVGVAPESVTACLITHEHADHVKGAAQAAAKWGWRLHATTGTIAACRALADAGAQAFAAGTTVDVPGFALSTARTPHDARESVAVVATAVASGARAGVCYDLGSVPESVRLMLGDLDLLVLEANHDADLLRAGPYPPSVASRIGGRFGHLSNETAARLARVLATRGLRHVVLAHLSESCNAPSTALSAVREGLTGTKFRGALAAAGQDEVAGPFLAGPPRKAAVAAQQLSLGF